MNSLVKICGLSTPESVRTAQCGGATHLGFIFFPKSPRNVSPQQAARLVQDVADIKTVAVTVNADNQFLNEITEAMNPDILQLHGAESSKRVAEIKQRYQRPVMKALAIREASDLDRIANYEGIADMFLLDAKPPEGSQLPGGNGVSFDWSLIAGLHSRLPILLSGGIDQSNLNQALDYVQQDQNDLIGIDVSSGVESSPGVKDILKIEKFLAACHQRKNKD
ncbi:MAG: phosphoribosylanthranilate isomerase [Rhizobiaceae bacterium]|nr:phosphoribosylanthranilate isomerase [Rhizobiaceae bacterium]